MSRWISLLVISLMVVPLVACGGPAGDSMDGAQEPSDAPAAVEEAPASDTTVEEEPTADASSTSGDALDLSSLPAAVLPDTDVYYQLQTQLTESGAMCLEGQGGAAPDSGAVLDGAGFMNDCQEVTGQLWKFVPDIDGYYRLHNQIGEENGLCAEGNRLAEDSVLGGALVMMPCDDVTGQLWKLLDAGDGYYRLQSQFLEGENMCLDSQGGAAPGSGAVLDGAAFMDACREVTGQLWRLIPQGTEAAAHWTYDEEETAPAHWAEHYPDCAGIKQSPIDVTTALGSNLEDIVFSYAESAVTVFNSGHTIQAVYDEGSSIAVSGTTYPLKQFHFHSPSEHTVDGVPAAAELHLVHAIEVGGKVVSRAVVGVLIQEGEENPAFASVWANLPKVVSEESDAKTIAGAFVNADDLLPDVRTYYTYPGSLTTPPCTEGVTWLLLTTPIEMSAKQIADFKAIIEDNNRPVQPLNDREVLEDTIDG